MNCAILASFFFCTFFFTSCYFFSSASGSFFTFLISFSFSNMVLILNGYLLKSSSSSFLGSLHGLCVCFSSRCAVSFLLFDSRWLIHQSFSLLFFDRLILKAYQSTFTTCGFPG